MTVYENNPATLLGFTAFILAFFVVFFLIISAEVRAYRRDKAIEENMLWLADQIDEVAAATQVMGRSMIVTNPAIQNTNPLTGMSWEEIVKATERVSNVRDEIEAHDATPIELMEALTTPMPSVATIPMRSISDVTSLVAGVAA